MTRINVVPVSELSDNHILAEYYELPRMWPLIYRAMQKDDRDLPDTYRLGSGHLRFFYNKIDYLSKRYVRLYVEAIKRNIQLQSDSNIKITLTDCKLLSLDPFWFQDYEPTEEALALNRSRLAERSAFSGGTYR